MASSSSSTKSIALNLGVFLLDQNVRRSVGSLSYNYPSASAAVTTFSTIVSARQTFTFTTAASASAVTILSSSQNVDLDLTLASPLAPYSVKSTRLHVIDSDVRTIVIQNTGTTDSEIRIFQA